jgi:transposase
MDVAHIAPLAFTSEDRVRAVIHNFNADGLDSLYPRYRGGRPPTFTLPQRREIKKIALARPTDHGLPFSTWSLSKLAEHLVAEGVVDDISHEGLRVLLREEGLSFQAVGTWKTSNDPDFDAKKNRILELYGLADGKIEPTPGDPTVVICVDEFGPLNLQPHPGRQWAPVGGKHAEPGRAGDVERSTSGRTECGIWFPATTCRPTGSTGTSTSARDEPSSWHSCDTCHAAPARGAHRCRARQLQPTPVNQDRPTRRCGRQRTTSN